ncbi:hypothetical protein KS4_05780 [Poriferisphaera corsica]|uniref:Recombination-associated protein RdgC n=1 Tax=Poriferisphaera corsica TaxID=2528020 RepID=A0A517YQN9_9BACT|nr:hypothetical protein [Poriferisphaera corsica]QDU32546.1 hypothetical protein KS4_05780 [Poriferisphaera corsica]
MGFKSGRVTYCRFKVMGDGPSSVDEAALSILNEHRFREVEIGAPDEVEVGFVTGDHILDTQFSYEKNGFGNLLMFAIRIDTHKVPSEMKQAYKMMNEQAAASGNPSGFASKADKRDAKELAERQIHEDLASGKYRKSKMVPVLWDLKAGYMYLGGASNAIIEELCRVMRHAFAVDLEYVSGGTYAGHSLREKHSGRDFDDFRPTKYTKPPAAAALIHDEDDASGDAAYGGSQGGGEPIVPWVAKSTDLKDFLGNEWLMWLWFVCEKFDGLISAKVDGVDEEIFVAITKSLQMECAWDAGGKVSLSGDGVRVYKEAGEALVQGKWARKFGMILSSGEDTFELNLQGDKYVIGSALLPEIMEAETPREIVEARLLKIMVLSQLLDAVYDVFLEQRSNTGKWANIKNEMSKWIKERRLEKVAVAMKEEVVAAG